VNHPMDRLAIVSGGDGLRPKATPEPSIIIDPGLARSPRPAAWQRESITSRENKFPPSDSETAKAN